MRNRSLRIILFSGHVIASVTASIHIRQSAPVQWGACQHSESLHWEGVDDNTASALLTCANFTVPLDWSNASNGQNATLYVARIRATAETSLGTIFVNPGGPGAPGSQFLADPITELLHNITGGSFDLVTWDPRGTGYSQPVINCFENWEGDGTIAGISPLNFQNNLFRNTLQARSSGPTQADIDTFVNNATNVEAYFQTFVKECARLNGDNLKYVGTVATVKDLVALADAIEGPGKPVRYWGFSYGTVLGSYFLDLYPDRVGRFVLDGVLDAQAYSQNPPYKAHRVSIRDAEKAVDAYLDACAVAGPGKCAIATQGSTSATLRQWASTLIDLSYDIAAASGGAAWSPFDSNDIRRQLSNAATLPSMWRMFSDMLHGLDAQIHSAANSSSTAKQYLPRMNHFHSTLEKRQVNSMYYLLATQVSAVYAIACGDSIDNEGITTTAAFNELVRYTTEISGTFGPAGITFPTTFCHLWPARAVERHPAAETPKLANQVLIIGNTYDPVTPLDSARKLTSRLNSGGPRQASLIQHNGTGHMSLQSYSVCTYDIIQQYFINGVFPNDTLCNIDGNAFDTNNMGISTYNTNATYSTSSALPSFYGITLSNGGPRDSHLASLPFVWMIVGMLASGMSLLWI